MFFYGERVEEGGVGFSVFISLFCGGKINNHKCVLYESVAGGLANGKEVGLAG